jgi:hypothetical protein
MGIMTELNDDTIFDVIEKDSKTKISGFFLIGRHVKLNFNFFFVRD